MLNEEGKHVVCGACNRGGRKDYRQGGAAHLQAAEKVGLGRSPEGDVTSVAGDKGGMPLMTGVGRAND